MMSPTIQELDGALQRTVGIHARTCYRDHTHVVYKLGDRAERRAYTISADGGVTFGAPEAGRVTYRPAPPIESAPPVLSDDGTDLNAAAQAIMKRDSCDFPTACSRAAAEHPELAERWAANPPNRTHRPTVAAQQTAAASELNVLALSRAKEKGISFVQASREVADERQDLVTQYRGGKEPEPLRCDPATTRILELALARSAERQIPYDKAVREIAAEHVDLAERHVVAIRGVR